MINFTRYCMLMVAEINGASLSPGDYGDMKAFRQSNPHLHLCTFCSHKPDCRLAVPNTMVSSCRKFKIGILK